MNIQLILNKKDYRCPVDQQQFDRRQQAFVVYLKPEGAFSLKPFTRQFSMTNFFIFSFNTHEQEQQLKKKAITSNKINNMNQINGIEMKNTNNKNRTNTEE